MRRGILAVWSDVASAGEADYDAWYEREHMFDRLAVAGFHRARHYRTVLGEPRYFTYFITDSVEVMASEAYLASANNPSPWTRRVLPHFRNTNRTACNVVRRVGRGFGAAALTIRWSPSPTGSPSSADERITALSARLSSLVTRPGIVSAQLWRADRGATLQAVADRDLRPASDQVADHVVFVEGTAAEPLTELLNGPLALAQVAQSDSDEPAQAAVHVLLNEADADEPPPI